MSAFDSADKIGDGNMGWDLDKHLDMIAGQHTVEDANTHTFGRLSDNFPYTQPQIAGQNLKAVFGDPDDMIPVVKNGMAAGTVLWHSVKCSSRVLDT